MQQTGVGMYYITRRGGNVKVPHLAVQGVSTEFVLIARQEGVCTPRWVRCLFSLFSNVPHVACNVWVRSLFSLKRWGCVKYRINTDLFLSTQPMSTNSVLTPCKQGAVLSRYSMALQWERTLYSHVASNVRYISHLGVQTPNQINLPSRPFNLTFWRRFALAALKK